MKENNNTINPKKMFAIFGGIIAFVALAVVLDFHFFAQSAAADEVAAATPTPTSTYAASDDFVYDGVIGNDTETVSPSPSAEVSAAPTASSAPAVTTSPAGTKGGSSGSTGKGSKPSSSSGTTSSGSASSSGSTPAAGSTNSSGQQYVPGFGYVTPGGKGTSTKVGNDGDQLTGNKVGTMG